MKKNWKKIYKRLKRDIRDQVKRYDGYIEPMTRSNLVEQIELEETIYTLKNMLNTMDEFEGNSYHGISFTPKQFANWKKSIKL